MLRPAINHKERDVATSNIQSAGYGVWNQTLDCSSGIKQEYSSGKRVFLADNRFGDPSPGNRKYIYIFWETNGQYFSGVTGEGDDRGITIP
jgi:hypothetical protein